MSRLLAGASIGLMASNVYIADVASTKNVVFFNYTRQIFITLGAIMMYAIAQIIYKVMCHKMKQNVDILPAQRFTLVFPGT